MTVKRLILIAALVMVGFVLPASADIAIATDLQKEVNETGLIIAAHGDIWEYRDTNAPADTTTGWFWLFGDENSIPGRQFPVTDSGSYVITLTKEEVWAYQTGLYHAYLQFPGRNGIREIAFNPVRDEIGTPWHYIRNISVDGKDGKILKSRVDAMIAANPAIDDVWYRGQRVRVEEPGLHVDELYETSTGDLRLAGITNMARGNTLKGVVDEDQIKGSYKEKLFTEYTTVYGSDPTKYREWNMTVKVKNIGELSPGSHFVTVHLPTGHVTTAQFTVYPRLIEPTPTPEIVYSYGISGGIIGVDTESRYNRTEATAAANATTTPTPAPTKKELPKLNDRVIVQGMNVYIGETNLDILNTLGWQNVTTDEYHLAHWSPGSDFYEMPSRVITVGNPRHYAIEPDVFSGYEGEWYQWGGWWEPKTPIAFVVNKMPEPDATITPEPTPAPTTERPTIAPMTTGTPAATPTTRTTQDKNVITVPLDIGIGIAAVIFGIYWRTKNNANHR